MSRRPAPAPPLMLTLEPELTPDPTPARKVPQNQSR